MQYVKKSKFNLNKYKQFKKNIYRSISELAKIWFVTDSCNVSNCKTQNIFTKKNVFFFFLIKNQLKLTVTFFTFYYILYLILFNLILYN